MKRLGLALLLLAGLTVSSADAEYVIIRFSTAAPEAKPTTPTNPNQPPMPMPKPVLPPGSQVHNGALVELKTVKLARAQRWQLLDRWGSSILYKDDKNYFIGNDAQGTFYKKLPTVTKDWDEQKKALDSNKTPLKHYETATWLLERVMGLSYRDQAAINRGDMYEDFHQIMTDLEQAEKATPSNDPRITAALAAWAKIKDEIKKPLESDQALVDRWAVKLNCKVQKVKEHYTVFFRSQANLPEEVTSRIAKLERVFTGLYYWFALKGQVLPLPAKRLCVVILEDEKEFRIRMATFDEDQLVTDGFYARRDQLAFYPTMPLSDGFQAFNKVMMDEFWTKGWKKDDLLRGIARRDPPNNNIDLNDRAMTAALLEKASLEEAELLSSTQVGVEQIIAAAGLLPRTVPAPEWLQFGVPSCFAASRGALWAGFGGPNWELLMEFKQRVQAKKLAPAPESLRKLLNGDYFRQANASGDRDAMIQARCLAWGLSHFLVHRHLNDLMQYYRELSSLPRELDMDEAVLLGCFARAFKLTDPAKPGSFDEAKLNTFADQWFDFIFRNASLPIPEADLMRIRSEMKVNES